MNSSMRTIACLAAMLSGGSALCANDESAIADLKLIKATCERNMGSIKPKVWGSGTSWKRSDSGVERVVIDVVRTGGLLTTHRGTIEQVVAVTATGTHGSEQAARSAAAQPIQTRAHYVTRLEYQEGRWYVRGGSTRMRGTFNGQVVGSDEQELTREEILRPNGNLGECKLGELVR